MSSQTFVLQLTINITTWFYVSLSYTTGDTMLSLVYQHRVKPYSVQSLWFIVIMAGFYNKNQHVMLRCEYLELELNFWFFCKIRSRLIYCDTLCFHTFKSVAYHPHVMFLHIWLKIARECVFLDVCWHLIDQFFWCKMALCTCAMVSVAFFSNEFFLDVPSADIYLQTTTFGHWFINWFESLS